MNHRDNRENRDKKEKESAILNGFLFFLPLFSLLSLW